MLIPYGLSLIHICSARELDASASGYTKLLEESNGVLQDLKQVIDVSTLSMTDKDRMDVVDECYRDMRRYRKSSVRCSWPSWRYAQYCPTC